MPPIPLSLHHFEDSESLFSIQKVDSRSTYAQTHHGISVQVSKRTVSKRSILPSSFSKPTYLGHPELPFPKAKGGTVKPISLDWRPASQSLRQSKHADFLNAPRPSLLSQKVQEPQIDPPRRRHMALPIESPLGTSFVLPNEYPAPISSVSFVLQENTIRDSSELLSLAPLVLDMQDGRTGEICPETDEIPLDIMFQGALGLYTGPEAPFQTKQTFKDLTDITEGVGDHHPWPLKDYFRDPILPRKRSVYEKSLAPLTIFPSDEAALHRPYRSRQQQADENSSGFNLASKRHKREDLPTQHDQQRTKTETQLTLNTIAQSNRDQSWGMFAKRENHPETDLTVGLHRKSIYLNQPRRNGKFCKVCLPSFFFLSITSRSSLPPTVGCRNPWTNVLDSQA